MIKINPKLQETLEQHRDEYIGLLCGLIERDTHVVGHGIDGGLEENGQIYLEKLLASMGALTTREPLNEELVQKGIKEHGEGNPGHNYTNRWNLVGSFKGREKGSIIFDSHVDTMPAGELSAWKLCPDPWKPVLRDGKIYGLGACDMKAGLMAAVAAVKLFRDAGLELPCDVKILSVVDEEGGGNGSLAAMLAGHRADCAVVCEPSDGSLTVAHMGFIFFSVSVEGLALHSGSKWKGVNAIEKAILLIDALNQLEHKWLMNHKHPLLPPPTINIGEIEGGTAGSTVPDSCTFKLCLHYLPSAMNHDSVVKEVEEALSVRASGDLWLRSHPPRTEIYQAGGAFEMDTAHPFVSTAKNCLDAVKNAAPIVGSPAGNDARLLRNVGKMPVVITGPGGQKQCHSADEYVEAQDYLDFIQIYALLIESAGKGFCS